MVKKAARARGRKPGKRTRQPVRVTKTRGTVRRKARRLAPRRAAARARLLRPWPGSEVTSADPTPAPVATAAPAGLPPEALAELKENLDAVRFDLAGVGELAREVANSQRTVQRDVASVQEASGKLAELSAAYQALQEHVGRLEQDKDALVRDRDAIRAELGKLAGAWGELQETVRRTQEAAPPPSAPLFGVDAASSSVPAAPAADPFSSAGSEELSRELAALAVRMESFDRRLTEVLVRAGAARGEGGPGAPAALEGTVAALGVRLGVTTEEEFRDAMREQLKRLGVDLTRWRERDADGSITGWPGEVEADVFVKDGLHTIVWFESQLIEDDVRKLKRIGDFYLDRTGISPRLVAVSPFAEEAAQRLAAELHVTVAADPEGVTVV